MSAQHHAAQESDFRQKLNLVLFAACVLALYPAVFLRRLGTTGKRWPIPAVAVGALLLPILAFAFLGQGQAGMPVWRRNADPEAFGLLFLATFIGLCLHKANASGMERSFYDGTPWLCPARGNGSELNVKRYLEPLACIGFGWWMAESNLPMFGVFWMACGGASALTASIAIHQRNAMIRDRLDAEAEAEYIEAWADRTRSRR